MSQKAQRIEPAELTAEEVRAALDYDPRTGGLTWRPRDRDQFQFEHAFERFNADRVGQRAGKRYPKGTVVGLKLVQFPAEQLAWLHAHGEWPEFDIEFADGDPNNCALANLYEGDLPFVAGTNGPAHKRRAAPPRKPRAAAERPAATVERVVAAPEPESAMARAVAQLAERGMAKEDRKRLLREADDLL